MRGRGVGVFVGYALLGQAAAVASLPLLTRFLGPDEFGQFQAWLAWVYLGAAVVHLRLDLRLQQVESTTVADTTFWQGAVLSLPGSIGFSILSSVLVWGELQCTTLVLSTIAIWGSAMAAIALTRLLRDRSRHQAGLVNVQSTGGTATVQAAGGWISGLTGGMFGTAIGRTLATVIGIWYLRPGWQSTAVKPTVLLRVARVQLPYVGTTLLAQASLAAPLVLFPLVMPAEEFGEFSAAWRVSALPMGVVGSALGQYWIASATRAIRLENKNHLIRSFNRLVGATVMVGLLLLVPGMVAVANLSEALFGEDWGGVEIYLLVLIPVAISQFVVGPLGQTLLIAARVREGAMLDAIRLGLLGLAFVGSSAIDLSAVWTAILVSAIIFTHYMLLLLRVRAAIQAIQFSRGLS